MFLLRATAKSASATSSSSTCWRSLIPASSLRASSLRPSRTPLSLKNLPASYRRNASTAGAGTAELAHTRNIGIIAHIDAVGEAFRVQ